MPGKKNEQKSNERQVIKLRIIKKYGVLIILYAYIYN